VTLEALQDRLGYRFGSAALLRQALTHRSHGATHNERLEFLGDSVLNCAVASLLYERFGKLDEGDLSRVRANLVKQQTLFEVAQRLELSSCLLLGEGEQKSGGFRRPSILADTLEAVFGAIFLDGGFDAAQHAIRRLYEPVLRNVDPNTLGKDAKTLLQEWLQSRKIPLPVYAVVATHGAAHNQLFEVECSVPKLSIQVLGSGGSRRAAEQAAAKLALEQAQALMPATVRKPKRSAKAQVDVARAVADAAEADALASGAGEPRAVEPKAAETKGAEPRSAEPKVLEPKAADGKVAPLPARGRAAPADRAEPAAEPVAPVAEPRRRVHAA
jgi:ribonuclease-3